MKFLILSVCLSVVAASVVVNQVNVDEPKQEVEIERQEGNIEVTLPPPKTCKNVTVNTQDCTSIIVTRLPFLFNFMNLNKVCDCDEGRLNCDRGVGSGLFQRLQIPGLRVVYNANCKCKCPSPVALPDVVPTSAVV
ncbi:unnamed protein product [Allacma fusca]|uniref:Uncharacterized protein n=1 Tax=Allacma fusca TaxID=39272 RepID=A0A8J2JAK0_9HEXA|nr:unnamed protein product [Allacma fusca]